MAENQTIFHDAPAWEWALLAYLAYRGFAAIKGGAIGLGKLSTVSIVFAIWTLAQLWRDGHAGILTCVVWGMAMAVGIALCMLVNNDQDFFVDRDNKTITLPGSPMILILVLVTLVSKYWIAFTLTTRGAASLLGVDNLYILSEAGISGAVTGIFTGRFINCWQRYRASDSNRVQG
jgi:hypothetical protein